MTAFLISAAFVPQTTWAQKKKNPFLPTRAHIPTGQQLGVYFLPWESNEPALAVRFFLSKDNPKGRMPLEAAFISDAGNAIWREEIAGAVDLAFWGESSLGGKKVHIDFADDGAILISLKGLPNWGKTKPQFTAGAGWHVAPTDDRVGAQLMIAAPPPNVNELNQLACAVASCRQASKKPRVGCHSRIEHSRTGFSVGLAGGRGGRVGTNEPPRENQTRVPQCAFFAVPT